jgi:putative ubiquitin-RnfH superfamily antitoxin RatB of RatAB toxin-antitoxin module
METSSLLSITVVYCPRPREVREQLLQLELGCTAGLAVQQSGLLHDVPRTDVDRLTLGVWGRRVSGSHVLRQGDRVEVYRPLLVDPKVARRERFAKQGAKSAGLFAKRRAGAKAGY